MSLRLTRRGFAAAATAFAAAPASAAPKAPLIVGHRGAAGERPEHTAMGYRLAIAQGVDFIEPDLVVTKDGALIARHENEIGATTDVGSRPEFAGRKTTKTIDGRKVEGWFSEDFTLAEIRTLKARERLPQVRVANTAYDGREGLLTFEEVVDLAHEEGRRAGRTVGVYAELKHPSYFASIGLPMEPRIIAALKAKGLTSKDSPFILECFETGALKQVRTEVPVRSVFLMDAAGGPADLPGRSYAEFATPAGLREIAGFATGVGPAKEMIVPRRPDGRSASPTRLVAEAHAAGLMVHPYTFRSENMFLPAELRRGDPADPAFLRAPGDHRAEYLQFFALGVDGLFTDNPDAAVAARRDFLAGARA